MNELIDRWIECAQQEGKAVKEEKQYDYGCEPFPSQTTTPHPQKFLCSGYKLAFGSLVIVKTLTLSLCIPRETIVSSNKRRVAFIHSLLSAGFAIYLLRNADNLHYHLFPPSSPSPTIQIACFFNDNNPNYPQ